MPTRLLRGGGFQSCRPPQQFVHQRGDFAGGGAVGRCLACEPASGHAVGEDDALMHLRAQRGQRLFGQRLPRLAPMMVLTRRLMTKAARSAGRNTCASRISATISAEAHRS
jgi:hypothetical protein